MEAAGSQSSGGGAAASIQSTAGASQRLQ